MKNARDRRLNIVASIKLCMFKSSASIHYADDVFKEEHQFSRISKIWSNDAYTNVFWTSYSFYGTAIKKKVKSTIIQFRYTNYHLVFIFLKHKTKLLTWSKYNWQFAVGLKVVFRLRIKLDSTTNYYFFPYHQLLL